MIKDKNAHFLLEAYGVNGEHIVSAPFFGAAANEKAFPESEFMIDYREFFRSYRTSFFHWLRENGVADSPDDSHERFRQLMRRYGEVGNEDEDMKLDELIQEIYETPMSAASGETENLEWRYLAWLAKGGKS